MSILMKQGDYALDGKGSVLSVGGGEAVICDVLFRLCARRGGFPLMPELGSRMYCLRRDRPSARTLLARQYAVEALRGMDDVAVTDAVVSPVGDGLLVQVHLLWQGRALTVELEG